MSQPKEMPLDGPSAKKLHKRTIKAQQSAARDHDTASVAAHRKDCDLCNRPQDVLIRCQIDASGRWHMLCKSGCWQKASDSKIDGTPDTPFYKYGGM